MEEAIKQRIKDWCGFVDDDEAGEVEIDKKASLKENIMVFVVAFILVACLFGFWFKYYQFNTIYDMVDDELVVIDEYVVSNSPFALKSIKAGDKVKVYFENGYELTEKVKEVLPDGVILTNADGETKFFSNYQIQGKVVNNLTSGLFSLLAYFLKLIH